MTYTRLNRLWNNKLYLILFAGCVLGIFYTSFNNPIAFILFLYIFGGECSDFERDYQNVKKAHIKLGVES